MTCINSPSNLLLAIYHLKGEFGVKFIARIAKTFIFLRGQWIGKNRTFDFFYVLYVALSVSLAMFTDFILKAQKKISFLHPHHYSLSGTPKKIVLLFHYIPINFYFRDISKRTFWYVLTKNFLPLFLIEHKSWSITILSSISLSFLLHSIDICVYGYFYLMVWEIYIFSSLFFVWEYWKLKLEGIIIL